MNAVAMTMENPAVPGNPATIYTGVTAALGIAIANITGSDITLGSNSSLEIFFPLYFTAAQLQQMAINNISQDGWAFSYNSANISLLLSRSAETGIWAANQQISFTVANLSSSATPNLDAVQVNLSGMSGSNIPSQLSGPLALVAKPAPGSLDLQDMLSVDAAQGGALYVSTSANPLSNTFYLNLKNIGATPLFKGKAMWTGTPRITISFVYGTTSGSLAPDDKQDVSELGSAWAIGGAIYVDQTAGWTMQNPVVSGQANTPIWTLAPIATNQQIIGTGDHANVSIAFSNVISLTPIGPTQMYVQFSGFMADDNTPYNDRVFVVALDKLNPPNPGALGIYCPLDSFQVNSAKQIISIPLQWSMCDVGSIELTFFVTEGQLPSVRHSYGTAHPSLNYDSRIYDVTGITMTEHMTVFCSAYSDSNWQNLLNKVQCSVPFVFPPVIHSFEVNTTLSASTFHLTWDCAGATKIEILADSGNGQPVLLPISPGAVSFLDNPTSSITTYTLIVTGNISQERTTSMDNNQTLQSTNISQSVTVAILLPTGSVISYAGTAAPVGWLLCDGNVIPAGSLYAGLVALFPSGKTPDLRSRFIAGAVADPKNIVPPLPAGLSAYGTYKSGGAEYITLNITQIPSHRHIINGGNFGIYDGSFGGKSTGEDHPFETSPKIMKVGTDYSGGNLPHENIPPYYALTYIIKI